MFISGLLLTPAIFAQTDITEQYIINPSFEDDGVDIFNPTRPIGWEYTDNTYGWCGANTDGDAATKDGNYIFGIWGNKINDFELYQTIENLPKGIYSVSCDIMVAKNDNGTRMSTQRVFAGNDEIGYKSQYFGSKGDYLPINLSKDETYSFAGNKETTGDASALQKTTVILDFPGGDLKIGFRTNGTASAGYEFTENNYGGVGWFKLDNFRLQSYSEDEKIIFYKSQVRDAVFILYTLDYDSMPYGYETEVNNLIIKANNIANNSTDTEEVLGVIDEINSLVIVLEESAKSWKKLNGLIKESEEALAMSYNGVNEFKEKLDIALKVFDADESLTADFDLAYETLEAELFNYRSNAIATSANPLDYTWRISSPHFTNVYESIANEDERFMGTWQTDITSSNGDYKLATNTDKNCWNSWSSSFTYMSIFQELEGLPEGLYSISCLTSTDGPISNQHAFATSSITTAVSNPPSAESQTTTSPFKPNAIWEMIETEKVLVGEDGKLKIGMCSDGTNGNAGWFCVTDFKLYYYGNEDALANYDDALNNMIVKAQELLSSEMLKTDIASIEQSINIAQSTARTDISVIREAIVALSTEIEKIKVNIKALEGFKNFMNSDIYSYVSDDSNLNNLVGNVIEDVESQLNNSTIVSDDLDPLKGKLSEFINFCYQYEAALRECDDASYNPNDLISFIEDLEQVIEKLQTAALDNIPEAMVDMTNSLIKLRNTKLSEMLNVSSWIINPGFESDLNGWVNNGMQKQTNSAFEEKTGSIYCEKWIGGGSNLADSYIYQTVTVPVGEYQISVNASATQDGDPEIEGVYLAACDGEWDMEKASKVNISKQYIKAAVYQTDENGEFVLGEDGFKILVSPAELRYFVETDAKSGKLSFGIFTKETNCNYLRFDDFELTYKGIPSSIESTSDSSDSIIVYVENGIVKVIGSDNYKLYSVSGQLINNNATLSKGVYIVVVNNNSFKVAVK